MARIRQIKPDFYLDDELALCPRDARLMFPGLWMLADRAGRLEDRPARIKAQVFPYDDDIDSGEVGKFLEQLAAHGFIIRYQAGGKNLIQIRTFEKHQHCHIKEPDSNLPPPEKYGAGTGLEPDKHRSSTGFAPDKHGASTVPDQVIELEGTYEKPGASPVQAPVLHRSSPAASGEWVSASGYMDNDILSVGAASGDGGPGEGAKPAVSKTTPARPAGDFVLTEELREWAHQFAPTIDLEVEAEKFRNYYGRNGTEFSDFRKAWRNWITRAVEFEKRARSPGPYRESIVERNAKVFAEVEAEDAAKAKQAEERGRGS